MYLVALDTVAGRTDETLRDIPRETVWAEYRAMATALREIMAHDKVPWGTAGAGHTNEMADRVKGALDVAVDRHTARKAAAYDELSGKYVSVGCSMDSAAYLVGVCHDVVARVKEYGEIPDDHVEELARLIREKHKRDYRVTYNVRIPVSLSVSASSDDEAERMALDLLRDDPRSYVDIANIDDYDHYDTLED